MNLDERITIDPDKRGCKPCIRGLRITVYDVLAWLGSGMSTGDILEDFPELEPEDIRACLRFAADPIMPDSGCAKHEAVVGRH